MDDTKGSSIEGGECRKSDELLTCDKEIRALRWDVVSLHGRLRSTRRDITV